ncbi:MAG: hypothetical protein E6Q76_12915 [Rhizobium sp.]|nr:MAG: hypothetical protein E6Q76_12915 [Rhizobium sp.]
MFISSVLIALQWRAKRGAVARSLQKIATLEQTAGQADLFGGPPLDPVFVDVVIELLDLLKEPAEDEPDHRLLWDRETQELMESHDFAEQGEGGQISIAEADKADSLISSLPDPVWTDQDVFALHEFMLRRTLLVLRSPKCNLEARLEILSWIERDESYKVPFSFEACCTCIPCDPESAAALIWCEALKGASPEERAVIEATVKVRTPDREERPTVVEETILRKPVARHFALAA